MFVFERFFFKVAGCVERGSSSHHQLSLRKEGDEMHESDP